MHLSRSHMTRWEAGSVSSGHMVGMCLTVSLRVPWVVEVVVAFRSSTPMIRQPRVDENRPR